VAEGLEESDVIALRDIVVSGISFHIKNELQLREPS
jgi:hypothetical protein